MMLMILLCIYIQQLLLHDAAACQLVQLTCEQVMSMHAVCVYVVWLRLVGQDC